MVNKRVSKVIGVSFLEVDPNFKISEKYNVITNFESGGLVKLVEETK